MFVDIYIAEGQRWFDANNYGSGFNEFLPLYKLHARGNGFLVRNKLIIVAEVQILPAIGVPKDTLKITEPLSCREGNQATDASEEDLDDDDESEEDLDDDDDASQEDSDDDDDDASSPVSDDGGQEICPLNQLNAWNKASRSVGNRGMNCNNVVVSDADTDDAAKEDLSEDGTVEEDPDDDASSLHQLKSMLDTSKTVENGGTGCNNKAPIFDTWINDFLKEILPAKETMDVNGFQVLTSQVRTQSNLFSKENLS